MIRTVAFVLAIAFASKATAAPVDSLELEVDAVIAAAPIDYDGGNFHKRARSLGPKAIPILRSRLYDPRYRSSSICSAIAFIGAPEGFPILRAFVWDPGKAADPILGSPRACTAAMVAQSGIGFIAKNSDEALRYLQQSTSPAFWDSLQWYCSDGGNTRLQLVELSIIALTYTERPEARVILVRLSQSGKTEQVRFQARRAITQFDEISKVGYAEYKRRSQRH